MLVIGALASVISAGIVLSFAKLTTFLDTEALAKDFNSYLLTEPARAFTALVAFYALSYLLAWTVATTKHSSGQGYLPDASAWYQAFAKSVPAKSIAFLTVELKDGRWVAGTYTDSTVERDDNRELRLGQPLGIAERAGAEMRPQIDEFILLREEEIRVIKLRYLSELPTRGGGVEPVERRSA